jgi:hypothetical protein
VLSERLKPDPLVGPRRLVRLGAGPQNRKPAACLSGAKCARVGIALMSAFKELDPIPQFRATAKLASFLELTTPSSNESHRDMRAVALTKMENRRQCSHLPPISPLRRPEKHVSVPQSLRTALVFAEKRRSFGSRSDRHSRTAF